MIIDQLPISDSLKYRNHRGIKRVLLNQEEVQITLGEKAEKLLSIYNKIEANFTVRFQYGSPQEDPDYNLLLNLIDQIKTIGKNVTRQNYSFNGLIENEDKP